MASARSLGTVRGHDGPAPEGMAASSSTAAGTGGRCGLRALVEPGVRPPANGRLPARIHITGGSGSGKTTLARRLGDLLDASVYQLDDVARDVATGRVRSLAERLTIVEQIADAPRWVTDGIHAGWTDGLCERADVIVWLDQVGGPKALARVARRFVAGSISESRRLGLRGLVRPRSYIRHLAELIRAGGEIRTFRRAPADQASGDGGSRAATEAQLRPFSAKVVRCRSHDDVETFIAALTRRVESQLAGSPSPRS